MVGHTSEVKGIHHTTAGEAQTQQEPASAAVRGPRRNFDKRITSYLEWVYRQKRYPSHGDRLFLSQHTGLSTQQVKTWFQNRRLKEKTRSGKTTGTHLPHPHSDATGTTTTGWLTILPTGGVSVDELARLGVILPPDLAAATARHVHQDSDTLSHVHPPHPHPHRTTDAVSTASVVTGHMSVTTPSEPGTLGCSRGNIFDGVTGRSFGAYDYGVNTNTGSAFGIVGSVRGSILDGESSVNGLRYYEKTRGSVRHGHGHGIGAISNLHGSHVYGSAFSERLRSPPYNTVNLKNNVRNQASGCPETVETTDMCAAASPLWRTTTGMTSDCTPGDLGSRTCRGFNDGALDFMDVTSLARGHHSVYTNLESRISQCPQNISSVSPTDCTTSYSYSPENRMSFSSDSRNSYSSDRTCHSHSPDSRDSLSPHSTNCVVPDGLGLSLAKLVHSWSAVV